MTESPRNVAKILNCADKFPVSFTRIRIEVKITSCSTFFMQEKINPKANPRCKSVVYILWQQQQQQQVVKLFLSFSQVFVSLFAFYYLIKKNLSIGRSRKTII